MDDVDDDNGDSNVKKKKKTKIKSMWKSDKDSGRKSLQSHTFSRKYVCKLEQLYLLFIVNSMIVLLFGISLCVQFISAQRLTPTTNRENIKMR